MRRKWFSILTSVMCGILIVFLASCFRYERRYTKDIEIYTPPQLPSFPLKWAVGPEGSTAHQVTMQIVQSEEMDITPLVTKGSLDSLEKIASGRMSVTTKPWIM